MQVSVYYHRACAQLLNPETRQALGLTCLTNSAMTAAYMGWPLSFVDVENG